MNVLRGFQFKKRVTTEILRYIQISYFSMNFGKFLELYEILTITLASSPVQILAFVDDISFVGRTEASVHEAYQALS